MTTKFERFGKHAVLAVAFTSLGGFLGAKFVAQGYEDLVALAHIQHTDDILTSLNYIRDGELELGYRMLEISLESGRNFTESSAKDISDSEILTLASDLLGNIDEYQQSRVTEN